MAEDLLAALDGLDAWPDKVRTMQKNWIGKSRGLQFRFETRGAPDGLRDARGLHHAPRHDLRRELRRDLARPSARPGAGGRTPRSPPSSPSAAACGTSEEEIETAEKRGFDTGIRVVHPFDPSIELPVYVANFVLMDYGTGAIFGCPAHDQRDLDFARKYGLDVVAVVSPEGPRLRGRRHRLHRPRSR